MMQIFEKESSRSKGMYTWYTKIPRSNATARKQMSHRTTSPAMTKTGLQGAPTSDAQDSTPTLRNSPIPQLRQE